MSAARHLARLIKSESTRTFSAGGASALQPILQSRCVHTSPRWYKRAEVEEADTPVTGPFGHFASLFVLMLNLGSDC